MNGQGRQGLESCVDVRGFGRHKPLSERGEDVASRGDTNRGQLQEPALFEFVDHAAGGKGFQLSGRGLPAPVPTNMLGYFMAAPVRVPANQMA